MNDDVWPMYTPDSTNEPWSYKTKSTGIFPPKKKPFAPRPEPKPMPHYQPMIQDIHGQLVEMLREEMEKARQRIMEQAQAENHTPEQIGDAMHRAYIAGIMWALENMTEIADRLGYPLPTKHQIDMNAVYKALLSQGPVTVAGPSVSSRTFTFSGPSVVCSTGGSTYATVAGQS